MHNSWAQLLPHVPRRLEPAVRGVRGEDAGQAVQLGRREGVAGAQQQLQVGPRRVGGPAAAPPDLLREGLPDYGKHLVPERHEVEAVHAHPLGAGSHMRNATEGSMATTRTPSRDVRGRAKSQDVKAEVERLIGERGAHVAADVVGGDMLEVLMKVLRPAGRYTTAGAIGGPITRIDLRDLIYKDLEMFGITNPTASTFARLVRLIQSGELKPLLEETYKLQDLPQAQTRMIKRTHVGKIVVTP